MAVTVIISYSRALACIFLFICGFMCVFYVLFHVSDIVFVCINFKLTLVYDTTDYYC